MPIDSEFDQANHIPGYGTNNVILVIPIICVKRVPYTNKGEGKGLNYSLTDVLMINWMFIKLLLTAKMLMNITLTYFASNKNNL